MRDKTVQKDTINSGKGHGNSDWVWGFDPIHEWDKEPVVPAVYAAGLETVR